MGTPKLPEKRRAGRYLLQQEDNKIVRFLVKGRPRREVLDTEVSDLSIHGLSFTVPLYKAPHLGESVALEFYVPDDGKIAVFGRTVRIEELKGITTGSGMTLVKVGVEFFGLPASYRQLLETRVTPVVRKQQYAGRILEIRNEGKAFWGRYQEAALNAAKLLILALAVFGVFRLAEIYQERNPPQPLDWEEGFRRFLEQRGFHPRD